MPSPIEEICATTRPLVLDDLMGRARPLVIRGACRDWPMVAWARESDTALAYAGGPASAATKETGDPS